MSATKIKGICKGSFKYISHLFVVKEREMEIGSPKDVKHVAHIGFDGPNSTSPSWMNEFKADRGALASAGSSLGGSRDVTWSSQDFEHSLGRQPSSARLSNFPPGSMPNIPKKQKRRKKSRSSNSSPKTSSARSSRSSSKHNSISIVGESTDEANRRLTVRV